MVPVLRQCRISLVGLSVETGRHKMCCISRINLAKDCIATGQVMNQPNEKLTGRMSFLLKARTSLCGEVLQFAVTAPNWYCSIFSPGGWSPKEYFVSILYVWCNMYVLQNYSNIHSISFGNIGHRTLSRKAPLTSQNYDQRTDFLKGIILLKSCFGKENWLALIKITMLLQHGVIEVTILLWASEYKMVKQDYLWNEGTQGHLLLPTHYSTYRRKKSH